ncbi:hypothetical protein Back11_11140 [Paenibacillus baekrokdamisoli]|uniref:Uncharacterized protein n=1 Tax=Paenibacillus baekrokdamisoli TaxID=1712516 RepID=A0A3G9J9W8_9BACL|nr:hypothetical protein Back11_11140 [Paenibacillus baekrokdamisoli]
MNRSAQNRENEMEVFLLFLIQRLKCCVESPISEKRGLGSKRARYKIVNH